MHIEKPYKQFQQLNTYSAAPTPLGTGGMSPHFYEWLGTGGHRE